MQNTGKEKNEEEKIVSGLKTTIDLKTTKLKAPVLIPTGSRAVAIANNLSCQNDDDNGEGDSTKKRKVDESLTEMEVEDDNSESREKRKTTSPSTLSKADKRKRENPTINLDEAETADKSEATNIDEISVSSTEDNEKTDDKEAVILAIKKEATEVAKEAL